MELIKTHPVRLGQFYQTTIESDIGELSAVAYYQYFPAVGGNQTDQPECSRVEISSVYLVNGDEFFSVDPDQDWINELEVDILDDRLRSSAI